MSSRSTSPMSQRAPSPFDAPDADIILRSSDNFDFHVHRRILKQWSVWWEDAFRHSSRDALSWRGILDNVPIVGVDEDARTMCLLLRHLYPQRDTTLPSPRDAFAILQAARKYTIVAAIHNAKQFIANLAPLAVYVYAGWLHMETEMRSAAAASLAQGLLEDIDDAVLERMSAASYRRLLAYHKRCSNAATKTVDNLRWMVDIAAREHWRPVWAACPNPACPETRNTANWFWGYLRAVRAALARAPSAQTLESPKLITIAVMEARSCEVCTRSVRQDLMRFNTLLKERVQQDVEIVELDVGF